MFIYVAYKDPPELSTFRRASTDEDLAQEKTLLVNPKCYVRVMLEFIRKQCKLAANTNFDLSEESGCLKGLFNFPTYAYVDQLFEHKKTYYLIVMSKSGESEKNTLVFPQVNRDNKLYAELQNKCKRYLLGDTMDIGSSGKVTAVSKKK